MEIVFLGTSGCVPTERRGLPALVLDYLGEQYLFDCGEGTQRQMRFASINFMRIDHVFVTHLHADHFLGLGGMIQSMDFMERDRPLHIHGPKGLRKTIDNLLSAGTFVLDHFKVEVHEVDKGIVLEGDRFTVSCMPTEHTRNSVAYCFQEHPHRKFLKQKALDLGIPEGRLFSKLQDGHDVEVDGRVFKPDDVLGDPIPGRKVVYTGDTRTMESMVEFARGADVLVHEATFSHEEVELLEESAHSTAKQAAEIALKAGVKQLYLTHLSQRYPDPVKLEEEAQAVFPESYVAEDLQRVKVPKHW